MTRGPRDGEGYMLWLEERWDAHKLDLHYSNGEREEKRTEEVLEMFKSLGELSRRGVVKVFRTVARDGSAEHWATDDLQR